MSWLFFKKVKHFQNMLFSQQLMVRKKKKEQTQTTNKHKQTQTTNKHKQTSTNKQTYRNARKWN